MKMWRIPDPWDYHEFGGYIILAETAEEAVEKVKASLGEDRIYGPSTSPNFEKVKELGDIYIESGCDC